MIDVQRYSIPDLIYLVSCREFALISSANIILSSIIFMDLCICYTKVIEIKWKFFIIKTEAEGANEKIIYLKNIQKTKMSKERGRWCCV